jgi:protein O-GlcNAc transferase
MNRQQRRAAARQGQPDPAARAPATPPRIAELFAAGVAHHQAGRLPQAEACYRQVLAAQPDRVDVHVNLANALRVQGKLDEAVAACREVIRIKPDWAQAHSNLALVLKAQGRLDDAIAAFREAIRINPGLPTLHFNLGVGLKDRGRLDAAVAANREAIRLKPDYAEAHCNLGVVLYEQGRFDAAVAACREAIRLKPDYAEARSNLGAALYRLGELNGAVEECREAIRLKPDYAEPRSVLGAAFHQQGKLDEAVATLRNAIQIKPDLAEAHSNLGAVLKDQDHLDEVIAALREAIRIKPDHAEAHSNLGATFHRQGKLDEAIAALREAIRLKPDYADAYSNLGCVLFDRHEHVEGEAALLHAIRIKPDYAAAHSNLGKARLHLGRPDEAVAAFREATRIKPDFAEGYSNLGCALFDRREYIEAEAALLHAIRIKPDLADAHCNLGNARHHLGKLDQAIGSCRQAIRFKPGYAEPYLNLGAGLVAQGKFDEAIASYHEAIRLKPDFYSASSALAFCMNYMENASVGALFEAHREWEERHGRLLPRADAHDNDRSPGRRLKIGYVSPDFRGHSVAYFLEPLLQSHDRNAVEVFCYAEVSWPDVATKRFEQLADHWTKTVGMSDEALAERIRSDGIDILVDLAGHTAKNRLPVFARKPAPVQVTWLGYPNTTGLDAIDYRLADDVTDPVGEADAFASETLVRLPGGFLCYGATNDAPTPETAPCLSKGFVTFGSFNNPAKLSGATLDAWAQVLTRLPTARLLLKAKPFADAATRALYLERLAERGVAADRLELIGWLPDSNAHLALYDRVDVALDPFPYNGTTTTCEALWMGVPVVTPRGDRHAGRVGASLLTQVGVTDLIADSIEAYVEMAVALAGDPARLADLRSSLRPRMAASPLCDAPGFARKVEEAYRTMWARWCAAPALPSG